VRDQHLMKRLAKRGSGSWSRQTICGGSWSRRQRVRRYQTGVELGDELGKILSAAFDQTDVGVRVRKQPKHLVKHFGWEFDQTLVSNKPIVSTLKIFFLSAIPSI
jgi:hypothetical protein